ncbi:MAG: hypothetical protein Fur0024_2460 [Patescibacteria group bacterium]
MKQAEIESPSKIIKQIVNLAGEEIEDACLLDKQELVEYYEKIINNFLAESYGDGKSK